jgi:hypothetical protein
MCDDLVFLMEPAEDGDASCFQSRDCSSVHATSDPLSSQRTTFAQQALTLPLDVQIGFILIGERGRHLLLQRLRVMQQRRSTPPAGVDV